MSGRVPLKPLVPLVPLVHLAACPVMMKICPASQIHVQMFSHQMYNRPMDVAISTLRADLSTWIAHAQSGEEVVITDRGSPVARLVAVDSAPLLEQLTRRGILNRPKRNNRPSAAGIERVRATGPVADLVNEQRD